MELRQLSLRDLVPAPYNPRRALKPTDKAYKRLAASLREFGLVEPLVWNEATGHVVGGHARLAILREMGVENVPVSVVRLSPEREKALNIVLNNREAQGRFDPAKLTEILTELEPLPELELTGFDLDDLRAFRLEPVEDLPSEPEGDRVEIWLLTSREQYEEISPRLNELVREFDLECHVKGS